MQAHERLKLSMVVSGVHQSELARRANLDVGYVSRILAGKQSAPPATLTKLVLAIHRDILQAERPKAAA